MVVAVTRPTRLNISQAAVTHNVQQVRESAQASFVFLAVKANAYGFGLVPMSQAALAGGVDGLAVAVLDEGLALRQAGITAPILVLGITLPQYAKLLADNQVMATVGSLAWLETAAEYLSPDGPRLQVNLAVDTGMGRIGFRERATLETAITYLKAHDDIFDYQSIMTHFSEADSTEDDYFHQQLHCWHALTDGLPMPPLVHLANSGAAMYHADEMPTDVIRAGTVVYGVEPSLGELRDDDYLEPVMTLETELVFVKRCHKGEGVSYGHTYYTEEGEWIGTVPVGYGDGLPRKMQGFEVIVNGERRPIVGKLAMDQMMISLPGELPIGTTVTIIGRQGDVENRLEDVADYVGLAPWEISTGLQERIYRQITD